jgi:GAF domain-containing protein
LENARLFDAAGKHAYQMDLLNEITRTALESLDHQAMLKNVADRLRELFGADYCYISLWDETNQQFSPGAATQVCTVADFAVTW